jgi:hypothetical protein
MRETGSAQAVPIWKMEEQSEVAHISVSSLVYEDHRPSALDNVNYSLVAEAQTVRRERCVQSAQCRRERMRSLNK